MYTAQNQADFMAATGTVTHSGPGGIGLTERLLAAGYPLAGDLSLGGFRAENITSGSEGMPAQSAVDQWTGDAPHLNTMLSPDLTEIGAGVSISNGRVYYVIDAARPTTSGAPQAVTPVIGGGTDAPESEAPVSIVVISTPAANGDVIHEVLSGQTLWQIAISYDVKIDDVKRLNNLSNDSIYPGEKLLIKKTITETDTPTPLATATIVSVLPTLTYAHLPTIALATETVISNGSSGALSDNSTIMVVMIGIIALAILGGGLFTRFGNTTRE
jgi:LysM repeat protein